MALPAKIQKTVHGFSDRNQGASKELQTKYLHQTQELIFMKTAAREKTDGGLRLLIPSFFYLPIFLKILQ